MRYNAPLAARLPRTFRFCPCRFVVILSAAKNPTRDPHAPPHPMHHRPLSCIHFPQFTHLLIWPRVQKMKSFRKSADTEGKFALTTPQNPLVNASPRELAALAIKQLQELSAATERKKQLAAAAAPPQKSKPPVLFADEATPTAPTQSHEGHQEVAAPDEANSIPPSPMFLSVTPSPNPTTQRTAGPPSPWNASPSDQAQIEVETTFPPLHRRSLSPPTRPFLARISPAEMPDLQASPPRGNRRRLHQLGQAGPHRRIL